MPARDVHRCTGVRPHRASPVGTTGSGDGPAGWGDHPGMIQGMGRRLRLAIDRVDETPTAVPLPPHATDQIGPYVDFVAYAEDCTLSGQIRLGDGRLTDVLNGSDEWQLVDVMAESFDGAELLEIKELAVPRDEIVAVHATGPRGTQERRHRTNLHPVLVQAGGLRIRGFLHARPGLDPLVVIARSQPMLPLTDASIEYEHHGLRERRRVGTIVVNRDRIDVIDRVADHEVDLPDLVFSTAT
jgi:hypothetical protein